MMEEAAPFGVDRQHSEVLLSDESFVQIVMQDDGESMLPAGQLIQVTSGEDQMHYLQVTDENGDKQLLQISADGQAQYLQVEEGGAGGSELLQVMLSKSDGDEQACAADIVTEEATGNVEIQTGLVQPTTENSHTQLVSVSEDLSQSVGVALESQQVAAAASVEATSEPAPEQKDNTTAVLDVKSAIELTSETIVMVQGKKCVLRVDPNTNHLMAYPFQPEMIPGKRGRGRPRKVKNPEEITDMTSTAASQEVAASEDDDVEIRLASGSSSYLIPSEQENSAIEGLLGLSEMDGRRKSMRVKRKSKALFDYETGPVEGVEEELTEPVLVKETTSVTDGNKRGRGRPKATNMQNQMQNFLANLGLPVKRGRGRPRRNPLPSTSMPGPIPAFIIPSPDGQAVMMAPMHGMKMPVSQSGGALAVNQLVPQLPTLAPKPSSATATAGVNKPSPPAASGPIVMENVDGSHTQVILPSISLDDATQEEVEASGITAASEDVVTLMHEDSVAVANIEPPGVAATADDVEGVSREPTDQLIETNISAKSDDIVVMPSDMDKVSKASSSTMPPAAIIQLPQHLLPLLLPRREPIKIGLKATESELEKLKCEKCDFQAYYDHQYQEHIARIHVTDVHKCKCCHFASFSKDHLYQHFKENHPKCICSVCDFMAEHAYVIKRHMMRHDVLGCECEVCGKTYKDQYILRMHIKMVHMPAEVLFECNVCAKKFTRKAHLKRHLRIHDPEKPFKCPHCDYRGCERSDITKHLLIHEEPKYVCEVCGKAFRHIKNKELHVKRHKGQRDYKCGVCDFYGYTFTDIRKHIERKHADAKIVCDKCGAVFRNDAMLQEHQQRQCEMLFVESSPLTVDEMVPMRLTQLAPGTQLLVDSAEPPGQCIQTGDNMRMATGQLISLRNHQKVLIADGQTTYVDSNGHLVHVVTEEEELEEEMEHEMQEEEEGDMMVIQRTAPMMADEEEQIAQSGGAPDVTVMEVDNAETAADHHGEETDMHRSMGDITEDGTETKTVQSVGSHEGEGERELVIESVSEALNEINNDTSTEPKINCNYILA